MIYPKLRTKIEAIQLYNMQLARLKIMVEKDHFSGFWVVLEGGRGIQ
jgi:hypothetical protein